LSDFIERLSELMLENNLTADRLAANLGINRSTVHRWQKNKRVISLNNVLRLAKFFNCSLEFLIGRTENKLDFTPRVCPPFYERLRQVMNERGITWYRIVKDKVISDANLSTWKNGGATSFGMVIDLANYFGCTLDYLVGLEN